MAIRLGEHVVGGEIFNTTNYSVHGWLELRGREQPLVLQLTGNCSPDLAGWHFRFETRPGPDELHHPTGSEDLELLATQQIGPTGTMTVSPRIGPAQTPSAELGAPGASKPADPSAPRRCLYLEWFSQNGRISMELVDPILEFVEYQPLHGDSPAEGAVAPGEERAEDAAPAPTDDGPVVDCQQYEPFFEDSEDDKDDPYELFPQELQLQFEMSADETDWGQDDEDKPQVIREMELMDDLIENSPGVPLSELFDGPLKCPLPDQLGDQEVEAALKMLLAQLALYGVALDVCEHFTPREVYRLLLEKVCPEEHAYPELRNTQWVQHYSTSDYCERCRADVEQEFGQEESDWPDGEEPDDEIEF